ncbi:MAG: uroporphyrinogen-III C-methyltransferase [Syntrophales bacterium]|nr:uroporphyrinogen-III C-methyltransferase [Syntrophales bacterium]
MVAEKGKVYIVGAGPGDPDLITLKGIRYLRDADVIIHDHLVSDELLAYTKTGAVIIYAGKERAKHTLSQKEINDLLVEKAREGLSVVRLKGGDPFVFGRGGEEAEYLAAAGIPYEIVPGVTSAIAVPAYAGIPVSHRGLSSTFAIVAGQGEGEENIPWRSLRDIDTVVFLMGVKNLSHICNSLIKEGKDPETPVALIHWGTTPNQFTITGSLATIAHKAEEVGIKPPAVFVAGPVVRLREIIAWFEKKPLFGVGVVVTRAKGQLEPFAGMLRDLGARVLLFPTIEIAPPTDWAVLDGVLKRIGKYEWLIFTSVNGVKFFFKRLREKNMDVRELKGIRIAAIGPVTASLLSEKGLNVEIVPQEFDSAGFVEAFRKWNIKGSRVLILRTELAGNLLQEGLKKQGAHVEVVPVYRTEVPQESKKEVMERWLASGLVNVLTFTSSSTVANFCKIMGSDFTPPKEVKIAVIGPVTAEEARKRGFSVDIQPRVYTVSALVDEIKRYFVDFRKCVNENNIMKISKV